MWWESPVAPPEQARDVAGAVGIVSEPVATIIALAWAENGQTCEEELLAQAPDPVVLSEEEEAFVNDFHKRKDESVEVVPTDVLAP
jgi:hypothetical protein